VRCHRLRCGRIVRVSGRHVDQLFRPDQRQQLLIVVFPEISTSRDIQGRLPETVSISLPTRRNKSVKTLSLGLPPGFPL
jgi:hypothetical protein